jgi:hypothetical protein
MCPVLQQVVGISFERGSEMEITVVGTGFIGGILGRALAGG